MAKAVYGKYTVVEHTREYYIEKQSDIYAGQFTIGENDLVYRICTLDETTGEFTFSGNIAGGSSTPFYKPWNDGRVRKYISKGTRYVSGGEYGWYCDGCYIYSEKTQEVTYTRGDFVEEVVLEEGSVTSGEQNDDGYWYEFVRFAAVVQVISSGVAVEGTVRIIDQGVSRSASGLYVIENGVAVEGG